MSPGIKRQLESGWGQVRTFLYTGSESCKLLTILNSGKIRCVMLTCDILKHLWLGCGTEPVLSPCFTSSSTTPLSQVWGSHQMYSSWENKRWFADLQVCSLTLSLVTPFLWGSVLLQFCVCYNWKNLDTANFITVSIFLNSNKDFSLINTINWLEQKCIVILLPF